EIESVLARPLPALTAQTKHYVGTLRRELARIRRTGYAVMMGEYRELTGGIAAPVFDAQGVVVAALCVILPSARMTPDRIPTLVGHVVTGAANVTHALAGPASPGDR